MVVCTKPTKYIYIYIYSVGYVGIGQVLEVYDKLSVSQSLLMD